MNIVALEREAQSAENRRQRGDLAGAYEIYRAALRQRVSATESDEAGFAFQAADLVIIEQTADLALLFGQTKAADSLLSAMMSLNRRAGNQFGADYTLLKRIHLALVDGQLRRAYGFLQGLQPSIGNIQAIRFEATSLVQWEARCQWPGTNEEDRAVLFSRLYLAMGQLLTRIGQYGDALGSLKQGLTYTEANAPSLARQARIPLLLEIAGAQLEKGELAAAGEDLAALEERFDEARQPAHLTHWLELSGRLNLLRGDLGLALTQFSQVVRLCQRRGFTNALLRATLNMGHLLILLNQVSAARALLSDVQTIARVSDNDAMATRAAALLAVAQARGLSLVDGVSIAPSVSEMRGVLPQPDETDAPGDESGDSASELLYLPQADNYLTFFEDRSLAFFWLLSRYQLPAVASYQSQLQQIFGASDSVLIQSRLRAQTGILAYYAGELERATSTLQQVASSYRAMGLKPELWQVQRFLGWCAARQGQSIEEQQQLSEEANGLLSEITDSLSPADRTVYLLNKWTADEEFVAGQIDELVALKRKLGASNWLVKPWRYLRLARRLYALLRHIDRHKLALAKQTLSGEKGKERATAGRSFWGELLSHPRDRATLSYLVLPDRVLIVCTGWLSMAFGVSSMTRIQVRDIVRSWHELYGRPSGSGRHVAFFAPEKEEAPDLVEKGRAVTRELALGLQMPELIEGLPDRVRRLTIVPDDSLNGFPFGAIALGDGYLIEKYALSIAFASFDGEAARPIDGRPESLLVGVTQGAEGFLPLPGVKRELDEVERWLSRRQIKGRRLMDEAAEKPTVVQALVRANFAHIACHGLFESSQPDQSGLVLLPKGASPDVLTLRELAHLDLSRLRHFTLSSCWAADHFTLPSRWVISLPETLCRAGAESVIGSLWEVDDAVAVPFMNRFYHYSDQLPRDEALRQAQLDALHNRLAGSELIETHDPLYWAGFMLYGDYRRLQLSGVEKDSAYPRTKNL